MMEAEEVSVNHTSETLRSPQMRKEVLRNALSWAQGLQDNVSNNTIDNLENIMSEADTINHEVTINEKATSQGEVLLDSEMMSLSSVVINRCSTTLTTNIGMYDLIEFGQKLLHHVKVLPDTINDEPNWTAIEHEITKYFARTPYFTGLADVPVPEEEKEIVRRRITHRDALAATKRPEIVAVVEKEEESIEHTVEKIRKLIVIYHKQHKKPLDLYRLILNPDDFGKTIENLLHVSFLVRDGLLKISFDSAGLPTIEPCSKEMVAQVKQSGNQANFQNIISMNMSQWKTIKNAYRLKEPMIAFNHNT